MKFHVNKFPGTKLDALRYAGAHLVQVFVLLLTLGSRTSTAVHDSSFKMAIRSIKGNSNDD